MSASNDFNEMTCATDEPGTITPNENNRSKILFLISIPVWLRMHGISFSQFIINLINLFQSGHYLQEKFIKLVGNK